MAGRRSGLSLAAGLWFIAALLAWAAVAIGFARRGEITWSFLVVGFAFAIMGITAWARTRKAAPRDQ
jgi:hypothetical protein